jgi:HEAT repeat protein
MRKVVILLALPVLLLGCATNTKKDYSVPAMIADLKHSDPDVRYTAVSTLGKYGPAAQSAVPALVKVLKDPDRNVRIGVTYALAKIGTAAKDAAPALKAALKDPDKDVRDGAAYALTQLQGNK